MHPFQNSQMESEIVQHITFEDLGLIDYQEAWDYQEERFNRLVDYKSQPGGKTRPQSYLLFC